MNEIYDVIGVRKVSGTSSKTGKAYSGINLYCTYHSDRVDGLACEKFYVSDSILVGGPDIRPGDMVSFSYNRFGGIAHVEVK